MGDDCVDCYCPGGLAGNKYLQLPVEKDYIIGKTLPVIPYIQSLSSNPFFYNFSRCLINSMSNEKIAAVDRVDRNLYSLSLK